MQLELFPSSAANAPAQPLRIAGKGRLNELEFLQARKSDVIAHCISKGYLRNEGALRAFERVPREEFFPQHRRLEAWDNEPLPLKAGDGAHFTVDREGYCHISAPDTCAYMLDRAWLRPGHQVLEIGTCSGYTAALAKEIVGEHGNVITLEVDYKAYLSANYNLWKTNYDIQLVERDGWHGYPEAAPYDRILVCAALAEEPLLLRQQLAIGGMLLAPMQTDEGQRLTRTIRRSETEFATHRLGQVHFVPLITPGYSLKAQD